MCYARSLTRQLLASSHSFAFGWMFEMHVFAINLLHFRIIFVCEWEQKKPNERIKSKNGKSIGHSSKIVWLLAANKRITLINKHDTWCFLAQRKRQCNLKSRKRAARERKSEQNALNNSSWIFDNCVLAHSAHSYYSIKMVSLVRWDKMIPFKIYMCKKGSLYNKRKPARQFQLHESAEKRAPARPLHYICRVYVKAVLFQKKNFFLSAFVVVVPIILISGIKSLCKNPRYTLAASIPMNANGQLLTTFYLYRSHWHTTNKCTAVGFYLLAGSRRNAIAMLIQSFIARKICSSIDGHFISLFFASSLLPSFDVTTLFLYSWRQCFIFSAVSAGLNHF